MRQIEKHLRRIIAVLLSAVLVFSAFEGVSITGYAAENTDVKDISAKKDTQNGEEENDGDSLAKRAPAEGTPAEEPQTSGETAGETREGTPEETTSEESIPEETTSEESISEEIASEESIPEETESAESEEETVAGEEEVLLLNEGDNQGSEQYTGTVDDNDWRELHISEGEFDEFYNNANEGEAEEGQELKAFDDTAIIDILTGHENDADKFDAVSIEYSAIADHDAISKELWNAVADFQGKKDDFYVSFCYYGEENLDQNWSFGNPAQAEESVGIQVTKLEIQDNVGDGVKVTFANTSFPAAEASFNPYTNDSRENGGKYEALKTAFGSNGFELIIYDNDENEVEDVGGSYRTDSFNDDEGNNINEAGFGIGDIKNLTANTEYTLKKAIYKGDIWPEEPSEDGRRGLDIDYRRAGKEDALTLDEIQEILSYHADEKFDEIYIGQPSSENDSNVISKDIANEMYKYLKTESGDCRLRFGFVGENESCTEWKLWNPEPQQDSDQPVSAEMTIEDGTISVTIKQKPDAKSKHVELAFSRNKGSDESTAKKIINILGEDECEIVFRNGDTEIGGWYGNNEWQVWLDIGEANEMTENTKYTVEKAVYKGGTWDWEDEDGTIHVGLNINYLSAGKDTALTAAEIQEILNRRRDEKFDEIYLEQPNSDSNVISKEVADMLYDRLKPQEDAVERSLTFAFLNEKDESSVRWRLVNPAEKQDDDQTVSAEFKISEDNKVRIKAGAQSLKAENVELCFSRNNYKDQGTVDKLKEIFGGKDCELVLSCENQEETDGSFHIDINEEEPEYYNVFINVHRVNDLAVDTEYTVRKSAYKGNIWYDEEHDRIGLDISYRNTEKEDALTLEEIKAILGYHDGEKFDEIYIEQPSESDSNVISKDIANEMYQYLKPYTGTDTDDYRLRFGFVRENDESCTEWRLWNPEETQESNQPVSAEMSVSDSKISVTVKKKPASQSENVELTFSRNKESDAPTVEKIRNILGEDEGEIVFRNGNTEIGGWYSSDKYDVYLSINAVNEMTEGTEYTVRKSVYEGTIWHDEENDRTGLDISYRSAGKEDALTTEEIKAILGYHDVEKFDEICIEQPESDSNVISKDIANEMYQYLKPYTGTDTDDYRLRFSFVRENDESCTEWRLWNPKETQESDQPVSAEMSVSDSKISVTVKKKPASQSENVELCFSRNKEYDNSTVEKITNILGGEEGGIVFKNGDAEIGGWYSSDEWNVRLDISEVNEMAENTEYTIEKSRIDVKPQIEKIELNKTSATLYTDRTDAEKTLTLVPAVTPPEAAEGLDFAWSSDNPAVAKVEKDSSGSGIVTAVSAGNAKISVTADGVTASCDVTVISGEGENPDNPDNPDKPKREGIEITLDGESYSYNSAPITAKASYTYTGSAITPKITITNNGDMLTEGTDYTVKYANNVKVPAASASDTQKPKITITGKNNMKGTVTVYFAIAPKSIAEGESGIRAASPLTVVENTKAAPLLYYGGMKLAANKDFQVSVPDKKWSTGESGGSITLTGIGNYTGTREITVSVMAKENMQKFTLTLDSSMNKLTYDGTPHEPKFQITNKKTKAPLSAEEYFVAYPEDITSAGAKKFTVVGTGIYTGCSVTKTYKVKPCIDKSGIRIDSKGIKSEYAFTSSGVTFKDNELTVTHKEALLKEGTDYKVTYKNNKKAGTAKYSITFLGNYKGISQITNQTGTFTIAPASLSKLNCQAVALDKVYKKPGIYKTTVYVAVDNVQLKASNYTVTYKLSDGTEMKGSNKLDLDKVTGTVTVHIKGKGNYAGEGEITTTYKVSKSDSGKIDLSKAKVTVVEKGTTTKLKSVQYDGKEKTPELYIQIKEGRNYRAATAAEKEALAPHITYLNNVNKGKATVVINGDGSTFIGSKSATFTIVQKKL